MSGMSSRTYRSNTSSPLHFINPFTSSSHSQSTNTSSHSIGSLTVGGAMAIFGKKKDKNQQDAGNVAGSPTTNQQENIMVGPGGIMNGNSRSPPPMGSYSREDVGVQQGYISHNQRSSLPGSGSGVGIGSNFASNGTQSVNSGSIRGPQNGMQMSLQQLENGSHPGAAGGFRFGGPAPRPDLSGPSGIPAPGSQMRGPGPNQGMRKMSGEAEGAIQGQQQQSTMYGPPGGTGSGIIGGAAGINGIPASGSGISGLPSSSTQGLPLQGGPGAIPERPKTQVVYPWSKRNLLMNPPRFLDEARQAPPGAFSPSPFPRYGHAANAFASPNGEVYLFGGLVRESVKNDLYVVYVDKVLQPPAAAMGNVSATLVQTTGEIPPPRVGHATILVANVLILWGGDTKVRADDKQDEGLYLLNLSTREWTRVRQSANNPNEGPVGRYGHTVAIVGSRFFVFGGQVDGTFMNDLWTFDLNSLKTTPTWDVLQPAADLPPRRTGHASVVYKEKIYIFGGTDGQYHYNDTWAYDVATNSWQELSCIGYIPVPREGHAACLVDDVMYIFGGRGVDGKDLGDLASFRIANQRWYMFANMGPSPSGRSGHALTTYQNKVVVLGGESFTGAKADDPSLVHVLDTGKIKYPPEGGSKTSNGAGSVGRKSNIADLNDSNASRSISPTERATSPSQRGLVGPRSDSLVGMMQSGPAGLEQQPLQQPQQQQTSLDSQNSKIGRPSVGPAVAAAAAPVVAPATVDTTANRAVSPPTTQRGTVPTSQGPSPTSATSAAPSLQQATTIPTSNSFQPPPRSMAAPVQGNASVPAYTGPKSQKSLENLRNGAPSPGSQGHRSINGMVAGAAGVGAVGAAAAAYADRGASVTSPTAQDGFHYGNAPQQNGATSRVATPANQSATSPIEADMLRKRDAWMKAALAMAVKKGFVMPEQVDMANGGMTSSSKQTASDFSLEDFDTGAEGSEKERVLRAIISLKSQLANAKSMIAQQAQGEADRIAEAERGRLAALSEAAFYRAKMEALEKGSTSEIDQLQRGRNADIEKQLSLSLRECGELERQLDRARDELRTEQQLRNSAEDRHAETSTRASSAEQSQMQTQQELAQLQRQTYSYESQLRDHKEKVVTLTSLAATHQVNHQEALRQLEDYQASSQSHISALKDMQVALAASTARAAEHEQLHYQNRDLVQQHESAIVSLRNDLAAKSAQADHHVNRSAELESLVAKHREEADTHKAAVNNGLSQVLAYHQQQQQQAETSRSIDGSSSSMVPLPVQQKMKALQDEGETLRQLYSQSKQTADYANNLLQELRERNFSLEKQQTGLKIELSTMRSQLAIALQELARLKDHSSFKENELRDAKRNMESTQVKHSLLKQMVTERGLTTPGDEELSAKNGYADNRIVELQEQMDSQSRELQETEQRLRQASTRVEQMTKELEQTGTRSDRASLTGGPSNERFLAVQKRADDAEREAQETSNSYRERMSQLENDYQTAVQFVKGSEKMLRRMKDELTKYKTENTSLQSELISLRSGNYAPSSDTEAIRDIEALRTRLVELTQENETVGAENRELERKMAELVWEQKDLRDRHRSITDGPSSEDQRRAKELDLQVTQLEDNLNDVRRELQETLTLNTHLSNELKSTNRGLPNVNGNNLQSPSVSLAKDLNNAQVQNQQLQGEKESLAQRLQDAEDKLQLLLGRMEGNDGEGGPVRDSHAYSISSELDKWERDRATDGIGEGLVSAGH